MAELQIALTVDLQEDLLPLSAMLRQRGVAHKIFEEQGRQVLAVAQAEQVPSVQAMYKAWQSGELEIQLQRRAAPAAPATGSTACRFGRFRWNTGAGVSGSLRGSRRAPE